MEAEEASTFLFIQFLLSDRMVGKENIEFSGILCGEMYIQDSEAVLRAITLTADDIS